MQPEFSKTPLETDEDVNNWLRFYDVKAPLTCLSVLISHDPVSVVSHDCHMILSVFVLSSHLTFVWNTPTVSATMGREGTTIMIPRPLRWNTTAITPQLRSSIVLTGLPPLTTLVEIRKENYLRVPCCVYETVDHLPILTPLYQYKSARRVSFL